MKMILTCRRWSHLNKEAPDGLLRPLIHVKGELVPGDALVLVERGGDGRVDPGQVQSLAAATHPSHLKI
jgi:hypothetical protein